MSLIPWTHGIFDPFSNDYLWDPFLGGAGTSGWLRDTGRRGGGEDDATALSRANVNWRETDKAHIITAEIPGLILVLILKHSFLLSVFITFFLKLAFLVTLV
jgi:hypothetical protein